MDKSKKSLRLFSWADYDLTPARRIELEGFCLQYAEKKERAKKLPEFALALSDYSEDKLDSEIARLTRASLLRDYNRAERALKDQRLIEGAVAWAARAGEHPEVRRALLVNVTKEISYKTLASAYKLSLKTQDFHGIRRAFFYRLDRLKRLEEFEAIERGISTTSEEETTT